jgi:hypothetical protein
MGEGKPSSGDKAARRIDAAEIVADLARNIVLFSPKRRTFINRRFPS